MIDDRPKNKMAGVSEEQKIKMSQNLLAACCKNFGKTEDGDDPDDCDHDDHDEKKNEPAVIFHDPKLEKIDLDSYLE